MNEFIYILIITILAELVAATLLFVLGSFLSEKARWIFTAALGRFLDIDVEYVFRDKRAADEDIRKEIERASFVYLLTGRGNELQRETFKEALIGKANFKILLPIVLPTEGVPDWTEQREKEVAAVDPAFGKGILREQIETTVKFLQPYTNNGGIELKRFNYPHIGRILLTNRAAYFTPYRHDAHGRNSPVIKYRSGGEMYDFFMRLFNQLWTQS